ncbi:MAG: hypothetical protein IMW89_01770 [Ktedonobacteraceae bacterium]|nr:hypothetical protein [Ktedonobacteraceae bacterium]
MLQSHKPSSFTPGLRAFISRVITPAVLVTGVLILILYNFNGVLKTTQTTNDHFHGLVSFSAGPFAYRFKETAGIERPSLRYSGQELLSYAEWSSTISVDGDVQEIWNNNHGYSYDEARQQTFSTVTGEGYQLIEIVTLVDDHTVTVTFNFVASPVRIPAPAHYVIDIAHIHNSWSGYQISGDTFTAQVTNGDPVVGTSLPASIGLLSLKVTGDAVRNPLLKVSNAQAVTTPKGTVSVANAFITEYRLDNPTPSQMLTLGTETITFRPASKTAGQPESGIVPLPPIPTPSQKQ